jgi:sodium pump decarboxylase gamma subunit
MELLKEALTIMALGMGLVFLFLLVVILLVQGVARVVRRFEQVQASGGADGSGSDVATERRVAAIAVALHTQRDGQAKR